MRGRQGTERGRKGISRDRQGTAWGKQGQAAAGRGQAGDSDAGREQRRADRRQARDSEGQAGGIEGQAGDSEEQAGYKQGISRGQAGVGRGQHSQSQRRARSRTASPHRSHHPRRGRRGAKRCPRPRSGGSLGAPKMLRTSGSSRGAPPRRRSRRAALAPPGLPSGRAGVAAGPGGRQGMEPGTGGGSGRGHGPTAGDAMGSERRRRRGAGARPGRGREETRRGGRGWHRERPPGSPSRGEPPGSGSGSERSAVAVPAVLALLARHSPAAPRNVPALCRRESPLRVGCPCRTVIPVGQEIPGEGLRASPGGLSPRGWGSPGGSVHPSGALPAAQSPRGSGGLLIPRVLSPPDSHPVGMESVHPPGGFPHRTVTLVGLGFPGDLSPLDSHPAELGFPGVPCIPRGAFPAGQRPYRAGVTRGRGPLHHPGIPQSTARGFPQRSRVPGALLRLCPHWSSAVTRGEKPLSPLGL